MKLTIKPAPTPRYHRRQNGDPATSAALLSRSSRSSQNDGVGGAILNNRLPPVALKYKTCNVVEAIEAYGTTAITGKINHWLVIKATTPKAPPNACDPHPP
ncbi:MAG: hypothetical protein M5U34_33135 [Chloroflexi bacterium]|nr:hypothetical protein [Chloroflexota bacterium]